MPLSVLGWYLERAAKGIWLQVQVLNLVAGMEATDYSIPSAFCDECSQKNFLPDCETRSNLSMVKAIWPVASYNVLRRNCRSVNSVKGRICNPSAAAIVKVAQGCLVLSLGVTGLLFWVLGIPLFPVEACRRRCLDTALGG